MGKKPLNVAFLLTDVSLFFCVFLANFLSKQEKVLWGRQIGNYDVLFFSRMVDRWKTLRLTSQVILHFALHSHIYINFMPYFHRETLSEVLIIANLWHASSRIWTSAEPEFSLYWTKLYSSENLTHHHASQFKMLILKCLVFR